MDKIYNLDNGSKLAIYSIERQIFVHTMPLILKAKPMVVANDFSEMLHSCIFNNTVYFVYRNVANNLMLGSLPSGTPQIIINDEALLFEPTIEALYVLHNSKLFMTTILKNPLNNTFSVNVMSLLPQFQKITIIENIKTIPTIYTVSHNDTIVILINEDGHKKKIFSLKIMDISTLQYELTELPTVITVTQPCENCKQLQEQITALTTRYNELVETAKKIQEEGRYWKHLYESS